MSEYNEDNMALESNTEIAADDTQLPEEEKGAMIQGIRPGGPTKSYEVNLLICYVLDQVGTPLSFFQLNEALQRETLVNYFEFSRAIADLEEKGNIIAQENEGNIRIYSLSETGKAAAQTLENALPFSVRERAVRAAEKVARHAKRARQNTVQMDKVADGYNLTLTMQDIGSDLMSVSLFLPTVAECEQVKEKFIEDPEGIYRSIWEIFLGSLEGERPVSLQFMMD